ncbi:MAG: Na/Pi symporter [Bacteroidota bacterium]
MDKINWVFILLNVLGGLVIFLLGVSNMSESLKVIASDKMKRILGKSSDNIFLGILTGIVATTVLDSSSVVIIMIITMVNSELLTSKQSFGIILGSNIGTAVGSQIIAFNIGEFSTVPLLIGFILFLSFKSEKIKQIGKIILSIGLIFFGLNYIGSSVEPLKAMDSFSNLMTNLENPYKGALTGALTSFLFQSSSATIGIVISLANQGLISLSASIAVMIGSEIGTCSDTLFASIGRSRDAIRSGAFHLFFNIVSVFLTLLLIKPFTLLVNLISGETSLSRHIAIAHLTFNILGVLLFVAFVPLISKALMKLIPEKK